jgi:peptidoglycan/LPS O-acetylase OafA/YrhL
MHAVSWLQHAHGLLHERNLHIFQRASPDFYLVGIPTAILLVWLLLLADRIQTLAPIRDLSWIRIIAEGTFSLYLMHLALFVLMADLVPYPKGDLFVKCSVLILTVGLCIALSIPMERFKRKLRKILHGRQHGLLDGVDRHSFRQPPPSQAESS